VKESLHAVLLVMNSICAVKGIKLII